MSGLQHLRQRKIAVQSTQKIINAMKMIAISRMKKLQPAFNAADLYKKEWGRLMQEMIAQNAAAEMVGDYAGNPASESVLVIVLGANRGLCGGFTGALERYTTTTVESLLDNGVNVDSIVFGSRVLSCLDKLDVNIKSFHLAPNLPHVAEARHYVKPIMSDLGAGHYREGYLIYTQFQSFMNMQPTVQTLFPLEPLSLDHSVTEMYEEKYVFEPKLATLGAALLENYYTALLYNAFLSHSLCEQVSRMQAMDTASHNAQNMIDALTLTYNRRRQESITNELMEIISGAESMKETMHG